MDPFNYCSLFNSELMDDAHFKFELLCVFNGICIWNCDDDMCAYIQGVPK